jgi:hypothetical protein
MSRNDESAFPVICEDKNVPYEAGLTKREYFAGMALQGLLARGESRYEKGTPAKEEWYARVAFQCADAMLEAGKE